MVASPDKQEGARRRAGLPAWIIPVAIVAVALGAAFFVETLNDRVAERNEANALLVRLEEEALHELVAEHEAIDAGEVTPEVAEEIEEAREEKEEMLEDLERLASREGDVGRVRASLASFEAAVDEELALIDAGRLAEAEAVGEEWTDPGYEALEEVLLEEIDESAANARRTSLIVDAGTYAAGLLAAAVVLALLWRYERTRRRGREALEESERRFRSSFEDAPIGVALVGTDGRYLEVNRGLCGIVGYAEDELLGKNAWDITHPEDREADSRHRRRMLDGEETVYQTEKRYLHGEGHEVWVSLSVSLVRGEKDEPLYFVAQVQDVTERKALEQQLEHRAFHDDLTGLPNRALFANRLEHALERADRRGQRVAVLFMDLDDFKVVNDSLGHDAGDELLEKVAERLRGCLRGGDTLARLGGDEFTVLLEDLGGEGEAAEAAARIAEALNEPFVVEGQEVGVGASIGIAVSGTGGEAEKDDLLRAADLAMYGAKGKGKGRCEVFDASMHRRAQARLKLQSDLRRAVERGEFVVHYQPKVHLSSGDLFGFEALVRWEHPERGLVPPGEFIPAAEEAGLIVPLGRRVLREACRQTEEWSKGLPEDQPPGGSP